ncbi:MAG: hypothetical protein RSE41_00550 [Clostridia bacterium]
MEQNINMFTELIGEGYLLKFEYKDDNHDIFECMCNDNYRIEAQQKYL